MHTRLDQKPTAGRGDSASVFDKPSMTRMADLDPLMACKGVASIAHRKQSFSVLQRDAFMLPEIRRHKTGRAFLGGRLVTPCRL